MTQMAFVLPAIKGFQAGREYYVSMIPLEVIPRLFQFSDDSLPPEERSQRILNRSRIPEIRDYILSNPTSYVFSALTVSIDGSVRFTPVDGKDGCIGRIEIPMESRFLINDGQHRQAAISEAIRINPELKDEHISVVFYHDEGLQRSQQMFSDLNRYAIRPTKSINILFNSRESSSVIAKKVTDGVPVFRNRTEKEKTTISNRSRALFTLSSICTATEELLRDIEEDENRKIDLAIRYWTGVSQHIPQWIDVEHNRMKPSELRKNFICSFSITLVALGYGGNALLRNYPESWEQLLSNLDSMDWRKDNRVWNDLVFVNGKIAANRSTQKAMSEYIKNIMTKNIGDCHVQPD